MKKYAVLFISLFCLCEVKSQNLGINHFIDINAKNACYIKAVKYKDLWAITLSRFTDSKIADTTFNKIVLDADTVLNAILVKTEKKYTPGDLKSSNYHYNDNIIQVQKALEDLQLSFNRDLIAGQLEIRKIITVEKTTESILPEKEWDKLIYVSPFKISDLKTPIRKKHRRAYYIDLICDKAKKPEKSALKPLTNPPNVKFELKKDSVLYALDLDALKINHIHRLNKRNNKLNLNQLKIIDYQQNFNSEDTPLSIGDTANYLVYRKRLLVGGAKAVEKQRKKLYVEKTEPNLRVQIQTVNVFVKDGFLDNISIIAKDESQDSTLQFTNAYPIPISSKKNIRQLNNTFLYATLPGNISYKLNVGKALQYYFAVEKDQYDLSPSDTLIKVEFKQNKSIEVLTLKKEDKNKIFEYRIFTDFIGLDEKKSNGLVQIEAQRKIKLYTKYSVQRFPIGLIQYIEPAFKWNKIESENSFLTPISKDSYTIDTVRRSGVATAKFNVEKNRIVTPLNLFQYQQFSAGFNLNLISGFNSNTKLKYCIDGIFNFGVVKIRDSISTVDTSYSPYKIINTSEAPNELKVSTLQWGASIKIQFFPQARYGFTIGTKYLNMYLASMDFTQQNRSYLNNLNTDKYLNRGIWSSEIQFHKNFDNDSKFYIRYVFNCQVNNLKYNFSQFQIGYNAYLKF